MDTAYYKEKYEPIDGKWYIKELLGEGSYGKVFRIEREDMSGKYEAALKIISIPQSEKEVSSIRSSLGMDENSVNMYFQNMTKRLVEEFKLMAQLKGNTNIVSYEDHSIIPHESGIGYDVLIRMELLEPLTNKLEKLLEQDVIRLGIDICKALEICQKYNIVHRDIKPENIFISPSGDYKLGDFGVAKTMKNEMTVMTTTGTYVYMAPELKKGEESGTNVDIYSLGMVMYKLLNFNREPFLPLPPVMFTFEEREQSLINRMQGVPLPKPANASERLAEIILKACEYNPKIRYESPLQMRKELENLLIKNDVNTQKEHIVSTEHDYIPEIEKGESIPSEETVGIFDSKQSSTRKEGADKNDTVGAFSNHRNDNASDKTVGIFDNNGKSDERTNEEVSDIFQQLFGHKLANDTNTDDILDKKCDGTPSKGTDIKYNVELSLEDACMGTEVDVNATRLEKCEACGGTGNDSRHELCSTCNGKGIVRKRRVLRIAIPAGIDAGQSVCCTGQGDVSLNGGPNGDLLVLVHIREHKLFTRQGADLFYDCRIPFNDAMSGTEVIIPTLDGKVSFSVPKETLPNTVFKLKGKGVTTLSGSKGDLFVKIIAVISEGSSESRTVDNNNICTQAEDIDKTVGIFDEKRNKKSNENSDALDNNSALSDYTVTFAKIDKWPYEVFIYVDGEKKGNHIKSESFDLVLTAGKHFVEIRIYDKEQKPLAFTQRGKDKVQQRMDMWSVSIEVSESSRIVYGKDPQATKLAILNVIKQANNHNSITYSLSLKRKDQFYAKDLYGSGGYAIEISVDGSLIEAEYRGDYSLELASGTHIVEIGYSKTHTTLSKLNPIAFKKRVKLTVSGVGEVVYGFDRTMGTLKAFSMKGNVHK